MPVLVKFSGNYADEFDCETFELFESEEAYNTAVTQLRDGVRKYFASNQELEVYFGTNEYITFENEEEIFNSFKKYDISDVTYNELCSIFELNISKYIDHFGTGTSIARLVERLSDYEEDE